MINMELNKEVSGSTLLSISLGKSEQSGVSFTAMADAVIKYAKVSSEQKFGLLNTSGIHRLNCYASILWEREECPKKGSPDWMAIKKEGDDRAQKDWDEWQSVNAPSIELLKKKFPNFEIISLPTVTIENLDNVEVNEKSDDEKIGMLSKIRDYYSNDKKFSHAVIQLASAFFKKNFSKDSPKKEEKQSSKEERKKEIILGFYREYILRESAARLLLSFDFEIYRGSINIPAYYAQQQYGVKDKMQFVSVGSKEEIAKYNKTNAGLIGSSSSKNSPVLASLQLNVESKQQEEKPRPLSRSMSLPFFSNHQGCSQKEIAPTIIYHIENHFDKVENLYVGRLDQVCSSMLGKEITRTSNSTMHCSVFLRNIVSTCKDWLGWLFSSQQNVIDISNTSANNNDVTTKMPEVRINVVPELISSQDNNANVPVRKTDNNSSNDDNFHVVDRTSSNGCTII
jgi:hypothetical protein